MKEGVEQAIEEISRRFPNHDVRTQADENGGVHVIVDGLYIGDHFAPSSSWVGFHITWTYPDSDVYPHFIDAAVAYTGEAECPNTRAEGDLPKDLTRGHTMPGFAVPGIQVSRRSNGWSSLTDTAALKLLRVLEFLRGL